MSAANSNMVSSKPDRMNRRGAKAPVNFENTLRNGHS